MLAAELKFQTGFGKGSLPKGAIHGDLFCDNVLFSDTRVTGIIEAQYGALSNKTTAPDTPDLQARHVRGRTIYALPDRVAYGYFDMLTRLMVESGDWNSALYPARRSVYWNLFQQ